MALGEDDSRTDTLVLEASRTVLATREDEENDPSMIRWVDRTPRVFGAVLEAASRFEVGHERAGDIAGALLAIRGGPASGIRGPPRWTPRARSPR